MLFIVIRGSKIKLLLIFEKIWAATLNIISVNIFYIGPEKQLQSYALVKNVFELEEYNVIKILRHVYSKKKRPYRWLLPNTLDVLRDSKISAKRPKQSLGKV